MWRVAWKILRGVEVASTAIVMVGAAGTVSYRPGVTLSAGDSLKIRLFGRGSHGSQPQTSIDPVIMAAYSPRKKRANFIELYSVW